MSQRKEFKSLVSMPICSAMSEAVRQSSDRWLRFHNWSPTIRSASFITAAFCKAVTKLFLIVIFVIFFNLFIWCAWAHGVNTVFSDLRSLPESDFFFSWPPRPLGDSSVATCHRAPPLASSACDDAKVGAKKSSDKNRRSSELFSELSELFSELLERRGLIFCVFHQ